MTYRFALLTTLISALGLSNLAAAGTVDGQYILFAEQEKPAPPIKTRILVSEKYVRFDDGKGERDYLIFDRDNETLYNVRNDERTIMLVNKKEIDLAPPFELKHSEKNLGAMEDAPNINDEKPIHHQYLTNGDVCVDVVSVESLMPEAVQALKEFQLILASDSKVTFNNIPADLHEPCGIAMSTFAPTRHLSHGFPVQEWKPGYSRSLVDYKADYQIDTKMFALPEEYFRFSVQQMREGRVDFKNEKIIEAPEAPVSAKKD